MTIEENIGRIADALETIASALKSRENGPKKRTKWEGFTPQEKVAEMAGVGNNGRSIRDACNAAGVKYEIAANGHSQKVMIPNDDIPAVVEKLKEGKE